MFSNHVIENIHINKAEIREFWTSFVHFLHVTYYASLPPTNKLQNGGKFPEPYGSTYASIHDS